MEAERNFNLPSQLEFIRELLEPSLLPSTLIIPYRCNTSLIESKFAGHPYLPLNKNLPVDTDGNYMYLLAQINFSEKSFPPPFPQAGILQIFISKKLCLPKKKRIALIHQQDFKLRYYPNLLPKPELTHDFSYIEPNKNFPIQTEMGLVYINQQEPVSATDFQFEKYLEIPLKQYNVISDDGRTLEELYFEKFLAADHKIGGYPYFIEKDLRGDSNLLKKFDTLLLQIVTNDEHGIVYGDTGILKLFINREKLRQLDFSEVLFYAEQY